jgi:phenylacetate-CoA ligase
MANWLRFYHQLPYPLRAAAASARGLYLRRWRYGRHTDRLVNEILGFERREPACQEAWQAERLAFVLQRAATQVPYYRDLWQQRRRQGDRAAWDLLENWPILDKETLRRQPRAFLADDCDPRKLFAEHTSGTTGKPLHVWLSKETIQLWFALFEARARHWYGVSRHDRWAILGGQLVAPVTQTRPPFWVWNAGLNQLYLSSYHLAPQHAPAYLDALRRRGVTYLLGYPSAIYRLAQLAAAQGLQAPQFKVVISNAEPLYAHQRALIGTVFDCPVRDTYGMAELAAAASECEAGSMHLWPEVGLLEVLNDREDAPTAGEEIGRFVSTGLLNADMPLIRYATGDRGAPAVGGPCACGRTLPRVQQIAGRMDDVVITPDGRHIGRLDPVFKADIPIHEAQIIQETRGRLRVKYVPAPDYTPQAGQALRRRLAERVGPLEIILEPVETIPRGANGKFRAVISRVHDGEQPQQKVQES